MLEKDDEGRLGAIGILSSLGNHEESGKAGEGKRGRLCVDLGGGSCQFTWLGSGKEGGSFLDALGEASKVPGGGRTVSVPLGAAALINRIAAAQQVGAAAIHEVEEELAATLQSALSQICAIDAVDSQAQAGYSSSKDDNQALVSSGCDLRDSEEEEGIDIYLSGGGLRAWGHLLMSIPFSCSNERRVVQPYPINHINGYKTTPRHLKYLLDNLPQASTLTQQPHISNRRSTQLPATARFLRTLLAILPRLRCVSFAQGGLREGAIYSVLPLEVRSRDPLEAATQEFSPGTDSVSESGGVPRGRHVPKFLAILRSALPSRRITNNKLVPESLERIISAVANTLNVHASYPKDICASAALRSTSTGAIFASGAHGIRHWDRAALAVALCERWGGLDELSLSFVNLQSGLTAVPGEDRVFYQSLLQQVLRPREAWWLIYLGRVARLVGDVHPAVEVGGLEAEKLRIEARRAGQDPKGIPLLQVDLTFEGVTESNAHESYGKSIKGIEKIGKKKHWPLESDENGSSTWGVKTEVTVTGTAR